MNSEDLKKVLDDISLDVDHFKDNGKGVLLMESEIAVLNKYHIDASKYTNLKSLLFDIEECMIDASDEEYDELDIIANSIAERNYYNYTNK